MPSVVLANFCGVGSFLFARWAQCRPYYAERIAARILWRVLAGCPIPKPNGTHAGRYRVLAFVAYGRRSISLRHEGRTSAGISSSRQARGRRLGYCHRPRLRAGNTWYSTANDSPCRAAKICTARTRGRNNSVCDSTEHSLKRNAPRILYGRSASYGNLLRLAYCNAASTHCLGVVGRHGV